MSPAAVQIHALHSKGPCFFISYELAYIPFSVAEHIGNTEARMWTDENQNLINKSILFRLTLLQLSTSQKILATFFSYGWVLHKCMLLTQGPKKIFSCFFCLCIPMCAKRKYVWTLLCGLLRNYLKCEVSSFLLAIMIPYLKHSNYLLISLSSVVFFLYFSFVLQSSCYENNNSWMWTLCPFFSVKVFSFYWVRKLIEFW